MKTLLAIVLLLLSSGVALARDPAQVRAFRKDHPCPATNQTTGACPGWVVDHMIPLCAGGPDDPANMQWQDYALSKQKDKFEVELCGRIKKCSLVTQTKS